MPSTATLPTKPPTSELGNEVGLKGTAGWGAWSGADDGGIERVAELMWPESPWTYRRMLNDAQINSLVLGALLPIMSYRFYLDPNNADPATLDRISADYNLPIGTTGDFYQRRGQRRFSFGKHLEDALRAIYYGHSFFEQVGEVDAELVWHLRKLGYRGPLTIGEIRTDDDGGLKYIKQNTGPESPELSVNRLVAYVWDREGANWTGRSMLRPMYRNHIVKDRILRVGAINIERAGGVPYIEAQEGATSEELKALHALAKNFRVGEAAGAALPHGAQLKFARASGADGAVEYIKLQNEEMARSMLQMFQVLGQTTSGSRSLGSSFIDYFALAQQTIADWFCDIFNEHVIEDDVEWNEGPTAEYAPLLKYSTANADNPESGIAAALNEDDGIDDPTGEVAAAIGRTTSPRRSVRRSGERTVSEARASSPLALPARALRREPTPTEISAAIDFQAIDNVHESVMEQIFAELRANQAAQIEELHDAVIAANGNLEDLAEVEATPIHSDRLYAQLRAAASQAATQAQNELNRQGGSLVDFDLESINKSLEARAAAVDRLLARDMSQSASRQAVRISGGSLSPAEVADNVREWLESLSGAVSKDHIAGAVSDAVNEGRGLVFRSDDQDGDLYSSELLDANTCSRCVGIDGTHYESMEAAMRDYPTGGFVGCEGRERCRGIVYKVLAGEAEHTA